MINHNSDFKACMIIIILLLFVGYLEQVGLDLLSSIMMNIT